MKASLHEAERDRIPHFRRFRDLSTVPTENLERTSARLGNAIKELERNCSHSTLRPLREGLEDVNAELARRSGHDSGPSVEVIRIAHQSTGSGAAIGPVGG